MKIRGKKAVKKKQKGPAVSCLHDKKGEKKVVPLVFSQVAFGNDLFLLLQYIVIKSRGQISHVNDLLRGKNPVVKCFSAGFAGKDEIYGKRLALGELYDKNIPEGVWSNHRFKGRMNILFAQIFMRYPHIFIPLHKEKKQYFLCSGYH